VEEPMSTSRIANTDSIEELARFWSCHDLTEFEDELEEVAEPVFDRETVVKIPLPSKEAEAIEELAQSKGLRTAELVRQWILERVHTL
jgi:flagellar biosynthesis/type III secretory pathway M-ring protein FliF/YscJ